MHPVSCLERQSPFPAFPFQMALWRHTSCASWRTLAMATVNGVRLGWTCRLTLLWACTKNSNRLLWLLQAFLMSPPSGKTPFFG